MSQSGRNTERRDGKLLVALLLFLASGVACLAQTWVLNLYILSISSGDWTLFLRFFPSFAVPTPPPGYSCLDNCHPDLPFVAGWFGICSFGLGLAVLAYSWWKSTPKY